MAKAKKPAKKKAWPLLAAALFCERILREKDEVASAIRIIDQINISADDIPVNVKLEEAKPVYPLQVLISFKSGDARGSRTLKLVLNRSNGEKTKVAEMPVLFQGEEKGVNVIINMMFQIEREGISWLDVILDGKRFTRIPLRVVILPSKKSEEHADQPEKTSQAPVQKSP